MEKYIRYFRENKRTVLKVILIIFIIFVVIQLLNWRAGQKEEENNQVINTVDYGQDVGIISEEQKMPEVYYEEKNVMQLFVQYCNEKNYESAYDLLTDECKNELYPDIDVFIQNYGDVNFNTKKTCGFQLWTGNTYLVQIREDVMATGIYNEDEYLQDYFTVDGDKLYINGYINHYVFNEESAENEGISVRLESIDFFMDYTKVNIIVTNKTRNEILLDNMKYNTVKLYDANNIDYDIDASSVNVDELRVLPNESKKVSLDFYCTYRESLELKSLEFKDVILDYIRYDQGYEVGRTSVTLDW